jgi:hypothetical protein
MLRRHWEEIPYDAPPSEILDFDKYPMPDPTQPWTHPEYADHVAREKKRHRRGYERRRCPSASKADQI